MSDQITLRAETGRAPGSRESNRIRRDGGVPGIIYGRGMDPKLVTVDHHDLMAIIQHSGSNAIITLDLGGETHVTMPKVIERHPFRNLIRHVDFLKVSLTETTTADVTVHLVGEAAGAREGGVLTQQLGSLAVSALPTAIPAAIEIDVEHLELGDSLRVEDIPPIEGVEFLDDPDTMVATVAIPRAVAEEGEAAEGEEGAEGEAEEGGDAEAADDSSEDASGE
ncbi:MAG: 50S ribosomal protein L25 [Acidimicrobiia bacterium]|nr:50S ribosomal protein L25 [Acidimicrobiia bacterium]MDH4307130.1 50S ribosomal protein L25 [Acidimicrobiia bacterium]